MNYLRVLCIAIFSTLLIVSCSNDDDDNNNNNEPLVGNYYPSTDTNIWNYDVDNTSITNPDLNFTDAPDFVTIETSNGNTFTIEVNNGGIPNGTMNGFLSNGTLNIGQSTLTFSGNMELPEEFADFSDETIMLQNFELYDLNAANNSVLDEEEDIFVEDFDLNGSIVPVTIEYVLTSQKINNMNSMTVNNQSYQNVTHSRIKLNMNIYSSIDVSGILVDFNIINNQDVLVIDNYFSEDIGLIKSEAVYAYQLEQQFLDLLELLQIEDLEVPESTNVVNVQELDSAIIG